MTRLLALVAVLTVIAGIVGTLSLSQLSHEVGAAPGCPPKCQTATPSPSPTAPPRRREDQITMFWDASGFQVGDFSYIALGAPYRPAIPATIALDSADYPSSTVFRLEATLWVQQSPDAVCIRLLDLTVSTPVSSSEVCLSTATANAVRMRSATFNLPNSEHAYALEGRCLGANPFTGGCDHGTFAHGARIIAEWME